MVNGGAGFAQAPKLITFRVPVRHIVKEYTHEKLCLAGLYVRFKLKPSVLGYRQSYMHPWGASGDHNVAGLSRWFDTRKAEVA
jgi:hypothetical protein